MLPLIQGSPENPAFCVDYTKYYRVPSTPDASLLEKIRNVALFSLSCIAAFALSLARATYLTGWNAPVSFLHIMLNCNNSTEWGVPRDETSLIIRISRWVLKWGYTTLQKTFEGVASRMPFGVGCLSQEEIGSDLDLRHLRTHDRTISLTQVPKEVTLERLMDLYKKIDFTDPRGPGYMSPQMFREIGISSVTELEKGLVQFVDRVCHRTAFVGTPPAHCKEDLEKFYQHIEGAVRFSIHAAESKLEQFLREHPDAQASLKYRQLLEDRARIAIDLAVAGFFCGARYLGEAMALYSYFSQGTQCSAISLGDQLVDILAHKRFSIAEHEVSVHFEMSAHGFSEYLQVMGPLLGLPGTEGVIEHLGSGSRFDIQKMVRSFLRRYTAADVIEAVQAHYRTSGLFREHVETWLVSAMGDWKQAEYENGLSEKIEQVAALCASERAASEEDSKTWDRIMAWMETHKKYSERSMDHYLRDAQIGLDREAAQRQLGNPSVLSFFSKEILGNQLFTELVTFLDTGVQQEDFKTRCMQRFALSQKIKAVHKVMPELLSDTIQRIIERATSAEEAVRDAMHRARSNEFLEAILLENPSTPLSPQLMEWMLVHHQIFLPQQDYSVPETMLSNNELREVVEQVEARWREVFVVPTISGVTFFEIGATRCAVRSLRSPQELIGDACFNRVFRSNSYDVIADAERLSGRTCYPFWRQVCLIRGPIIFSTLLQNKIVQIALFCLVHITILRWNYRCYKEHAISRVLIRRVIPFIRGNIPSAFYQVFVPRIEKLSAWHLRLPFSPLLYHVLSVATSRSICRWPLLLRAPIELTLAAGRTHMAMCRGVSSSRWMFVVWAAELWPFWQEMRYWTSVACSGIEAVLRGLDRLAEQERARYLSLSHRSALETWREWRIKTDFVREPLNG